MVSKIDTRHYKNGFIKSCNFKNSTLLLSVWRNYLKEHFDFSFEYDSDIIHHIVSSNPLTCTQQNVLYCKVLLVSKCVVCFFLFLFWYSFEYPFSLYGYKNLEQLFYLAIRFLEGMKSSICDDQLKCFSLEGGGTCFSV